MSGIENLRISRLNGVEIIFLKSIAINLFRKISIEIMPIIADKNVGIRIAIFAPNVR